jgi:hypothetical protein
MTRRMTSSEAIDFIETIFECGIDSYSPTMVEAFIGDMDVGRAQQDIGSYFSTIQSDIDPDTIEVTPDLTDPPTVDCVRITIKTED